MLKNKIEKVRGHAEHLLGRYLDLRERYSLLHPMLYDHGVVASYGSGTRGRGFKSIRNALFISCSQDIAKLSFDTQENSISVANIHKELCIEQLVAALRAAYVEGVSPYVGDALDPVEQECLNELNRTESLNRGLEFDKAMMRFIALYSEMENSAALKGFKTIRNKVSAHTDVNLKDGSYRLVDISKLGIKWNDIGESINVLQDAVELIGIVTRGASFAWDHFESNLEKSARGFWVT